MRSTCSTSWWRQLMLPACRHPRWRPRRPRARGPRQVVLPEASPDVCRLALTRLPLIPRCARAAHDVREPLLPQPMEPRLFHLRAPHDHADGDTRGLTPRRRRRRAAGGRSGRWTRTRAASMATPRARATSAGVGSIGAPCATPAAWELPHVPHHFGSTICARTLPAETWWPTTPLAREPAFRGAMARMAYWRGREIII